MIANSDPVLPGLPVPAESPIAFLADQDFNNNIIRGVLRRNANVDVVRVQDVGLSGQDDPAVLEWAAQHGRVLLTHGVSTMTAHAYDRVRNGLTMPGVFEVSQKVPIRDAINDILLLAECSSAGEWEGQIRYLPLR